MKCPVCKETIQDSLEHALMHVAGSKGGQASKRKNFGRKTKKEIVRG